MTIKVKEDVVVDTENFLQPMSTCPKGRKVLLKVFLGGTTPGFYNGESYYTGWAGLPKEPQWLKDLETQMLKELRERNEN